MNKNEKITTTKITRRVKQKAKKNVVISMSGSEILFNRRIEQEEAGREDRE